MLAPKAFLVLLLATLVLTQEITPTGLLRRKWELVRARIRKLIRAVHEKVVAFKNHILQHVKNIRAIIAGKIEASTHEVTELTKQLNANASALGVDINNCLSIEDELKKTLQEGPDQCVENKVLSAKNVSGPLTTLLHEASEILRDGAKGLKECRLRPICSAKVIGRAAVRSVRLIPRFAINSLRAVKFMATFLLSTKGCVDKEFTDVQSEVSAAIDDISSCAKKEMDIEI